MSSDVGVVMRSARFRVSKLLVITADCVSIALAQVLAYNFRFEFFLPPKELDRLILGVLLLVPFKIIVFHLFGLYRGMWRYTGLRDLQNLIRANIVSSLIVFSALLIFNRFEGFSRSVFLMDVILCFLFTAGLRVIIRIHFSSKNTDAKTTIKKVIGLKNGLKNGENTLLLGAGLAGVALIREIENNPALGICPVGFLDDDPSKNGLELHGVPVFGGIDKIIDITTKYRVKQIFLTMPSASAQEIRRIVTRCEETGTSLQDAAGNRQPHRWVRKC